MKSVRVRITALATIVVAIAVAVAAFALVRSVETKLRDNIERANAARAAVVSQRLKSGVPIERVVRDLPPSSGGVIVQDVNGVVVSSSGALPEADFKVFNAPTSGELANIEVVGGTVPYEVAYQGVPTADGTFTVLAASPLAEVEESVETLKSSLVVGLPFLVALVGGVAWFMTGRALRPVEAIRTEVEAISGGTLHRRVTEPGSGDEIARLAHTMNAMLDRLEQASTRQRQFASDASHELRSPVATIRTELEVALRAGDSSADWPAVAERVLAEEDRLESLVADLLLLATVDEGDGPPLTTVNLTAVVHAEAERARAKPVTIRGTRKPVLIMGRPAQLTRLTANLLDNASRHARSKVTVSVQAVDRDAQLIVDDDGPGIPPSDRRRVFERFTRLDGSRTRGDDGGAGLGLALVKAVVDAHGGTVVIERAPMGGARFVVRIPLRESHDRPAPLHRNGAQPAIGVDGDGVTGGGEDRHVAG